jgi:hypothetical protein
MNPRALAKPVLITAVLAVVGVIASRSTVHLILDGADGTALWSANEAYVFVDTRHIGHRVSYLRFPWFIFKNYLGGIEDPDDDVDSLAVIRLTTSGAERHTVAFDGRIPGSHPSDYTPRKGHIYFYYLALGGLSFWAGDHIEAATQEERQTFYGKGLTEKDFDTAWSKRTFGVAPGSANSTFSVHIGDNLEISVRSQTAFTGSGKISIDLRHPGKNPEAVWVHATHWGIISRAEYQCVFYEGAGRRNNSVGR